LEKKDYIVRKKLNILIRIVFELVTTKKH